MKNRFFVLFFFVLILIQTMAFAGSTETTVVHRIAGSSRFATAIEISKKGWPTADTVLLAYGYNYPDALSAVPLAFKLDAPILLCHKTWVSKETFKEIQRLGAKNIIILGGEMVIESSVDDQLKQIGLNVRRIAGRNRYGTAMLLGNELIEQSIDKPTTAVLVHGYRYADSLSIGTPAAMNGWPILFCETQLPDVTLNALVRWDIKDVIIVGGISAVSEELQEALEELGYNVTRLKGDTRYQTSAVVSRMLMRDPKGIVLATGEDFPDALAGGVLAAKYGWTLVLTNKLYTSDSIIEYIKSGGRMQCYVLGGVDAISDDVIDNITAILPSPTPTITPTSTPTLSPILSPSPTPTLSPTASPIPTPEVKVFKRTWSDQSLLAGEMKFYTFIAPYSGGYTIWSYADDSTLDNAGYLLDGTITDSDIPANYWQTTHNPLGSDLGELQYNDAGFKVGSTFRMTSNLVAGNTYTIVVRAYDAQAQCSDFDVNVEYSEDLIDDYTGDNFVFTPQLQSADALPSYDIDIKALEVVGNNEYEFEHYMDNGDFNNSIKTNIVYMPKNPNSEIESYQLGGGFGGSSVTMRMRPLYRDSILGTVTYGDYCQTHTMSFPTDNSLPAITGVSKVDVDGNITITWSLDALADGYYVDCSSWYIETVNIPAGEFSYSYNKNDSTKQGTYIYLYAYRYVGGVKMIRWVGVDVS